MITYNKLYVLCTESPYHKLLPLDDWNVDEALSLIENVPGAYGFRFQRRELEKTKSGGRLDITTRIVKESGTYYVNGFIETLDDIRARIELNKNERRTQDDKALLHRLQNLGAQAVFKSLTSNKICTIFDEATDVLL